MKLKAMLGMAVCAGSLGLSSPALADIVDVTYTGTLSGTSFTGVFGTAETSLTGQTFTARYTFDTGIGSTLSSAIENHAFGGSEFSLPSPNLSASFTVGSTTISFVGDTLGFIFGSNTGSQSRVAAGAGASTHGIRLSIQSDIESPLPLYPASITNPVTVDLSSGLGSGVFTYSVDSFNDFFLLNPTQMTISSPVPEPETYAMLLAGLGLLGFAARRRKQKEEAVCA